MINLINITADGAAHKPTRRCRRADTVLAAMVTAVAVPEGNDQRNRSFHRLIIVLLWQFKVTVFIDGNNRVKIRDDASYCVETGKLKV